jgi:membrane protein YdbS with pleckstrin-like domain
MTVGDRARDAAPPALAAAEPAPIASAPAGVAEAAPPGAAVLSGPLAASLAPDELVILFLRPSLLYIPLYSLGTLAASATLAAFLAYLSHFTWSPWSESHALAIGLIVAGMRLSWAALDWWMHAFALTDRRVIARRGILRTALYEAPLSRVQNTIVVQSLRERLFGLGTIGFATAGRGTFDAFWEMVASPFKVHRTVLDALERYGRRGPEHGQGV